jgi:hypothetical protein
MHFAPASLHSAGWLVGRQISSLGQPFDTQPKLLPSLQHAAAAEPS